MGNSPFLTPGVRGLLAVWGDISHPRTSLGFVGPIHSERDSEP